MEHRHVLAEIGTTLLLRYRASVGNVGYDMPFGGPSVTAKAHRLSFRIRTAPDPREAAWLVSDDRIQLLAVFIEDSSDFAG